MKGIDIFCASQASTSIRLTMDEGSSSSSLSSTIHPGNTRAIDRHNPIIRDARRISKAFTPCSAQSPINPIPYHKHNNKNQKGSKKSKDQTKKGSSKPVIDLKRKSACANPSHENGIIKKSFGAKLGDFISPPGSTRYLLSDQRDFLDVLSDFDPVLKLVPVEPTKSQAVHEKIDESSASKSSASPDQVVELKVSLHCKGCEGKVRKHISRMKGVTSFSIDFAAKKVTVVGDITPLGVLASVSKIKSAQLWTPPPISSSIPSCGSTNTDIKKSKENYENSTVVV